MSNLSIFQNLIFSKFVNFLKLSNFSNFFICLKKLSFSNFFELSNVFEFLIFFNFSKKVNHWLTYMTSHKKTYQGKPILLQKIIKCVILDQCQKEQNGSTTLADYIYLVKDKNLTSLSWIWSQSLSFKGSLHWSANFWYDLTQCLVTMETKLKNSKKSSCMVRNKFQKSIIHLPENWVMAPRLDLKNWAIASKFGQKKVGNSSRTRAKKGSSSFRIWKINRAKSPELGQIRQNLEMKSYQSTLGDLKTTLIFFFIRTNL